MTPRVQLNAMDVPLIRRFGVLGLVVEFGVSGYPTSGTVRVNRLRSIDEAEAETIRAWAGEKLGVIPEQINIGS